MSLLPLPKVQGGLLKTRKYPIDVPGTANISHGHKLRERGVCRIAKYHDSRKSIFEERSAEVRPEDRREYEQVSKTVEFEKETSRKIRSKTLRQRVHQDISAYEESLRERRERLRDLILNEETNLTREIVQEIQQGDDARLEQMRARTRELKRRRDEEHDALVAAKRMQQYLISYPDIQRVLSRRSAIETKRCNKAQMADNETKRWAEREVEVLWHRVMLKEYEAKKRRETVEMEKRTLAERETVSVLAKQVADKLTMVEEEKRAVMNERECLERLWEDVRRTELENHEAERQKREKLKRDLEEQILTAKRHLAERAREEAAVDGMLKTLAERETARERANVKEHTAALRLELLAYLKYLEDVRLEEARRNLEVEAVIRQSYDEAEARRRLAVKKFKETRERALRQVLRGREEQVRAKRDAAERERQSGMAEKEALEKQMEMNANSTAVQRNENRQKALRYGRYLKEQQSHVDATKRRELEEERKFYEAETKRQADEYQRLTDELLNASENITPHPFKVLLKQCAARYAAEREGRHYCPPALTST